MTAIRRTTTAGLVLALSFVTAPANADRVEYAGPSCSFFAVTDPANPLGGTARWYGVLSASAWAAADLVDDASVGGTHAEPETRIRVHCWVELNNSDYQLETHGGEGRHCHQQLVAGPAVPASCRGEFEASVTDVMFVCTYVEITHETSVDRVSYDADRNPGNGVQCPVATIVSMNDSATTYAGTAFLTGEPMVAAP